MRITLRLIASLIFVAAVVVFVFAGLQARQERIRLEEDLRQRASMLAEILQPSVELYFESEDIFGLERFVEAFKKRAPMVAVAIYDPMGDLVTATSTLPDAFKSWPFSAHLALAKGLPQNQSLREEKKYWHIQSRPIQKQNFKGVLSLIYDASYIDRKVRQIWRENFFKLLSLVVLISLTTLAIVQWSLLTPIRKTAEWIRTIRFGETPGKKPFEHDDVLDPVTREVNKLAESLVTARAAAEQEARLRHARESQWTAERLREHARQILQGRALIVVANREPYIHNHQGRQIECSVPASGLVTAVEPILRACGGTWVAHGSGDADQEVVDEKGRIRVPPDSPQYILRRVWLTKEEEEGYYYRFANEGLWPLCHIAHTRPSFRAEDWVQYQQVNAKFAQAVLEELEGTQDPCVLIQDYHFALLPRMIKEKRPDAKIALFWHIPWPNPEAFGICPWARELLDGMLGADILGFHIQFHCNNFLETVDRQLESQIDYEQFAINRGGHTTYVKPFPISIEWSGKLEESWDAKAAANLRDSILKEHGITARYIGVGVDRVDYTKGILERFTAVERLLEKYPEMAGAFAFIELGAPSRTLIKRYNDLGAELEAEAERINRRFQTRTWKPIVLLKRHHSHAEISKYYRIADVCIVTSLHDGMNLVAKEFVAQRADQRGVLILSHFAGASRELNDALLVNPYDIDQVADSIRTAVAMTPQEQQARMERMRNVIREHNVFLWAGDLMTALGRIRVGVS